MATDEVVDTIKTHIVRTPGVLGGKPRIAGRRIAVQHVAVWYEHMGMSVGDIVKEFDLFNNRSKARSLDLLTCPPGCARVSSQLKTQRHRR